MGKEINFVIDVKVNGWGWGDADDDDLVGIKAFKAV